MTSRFRSTDGEGDGTMDKAIMGGTGTRRPEVVPPGTRCVPEHAQATQTKPLEGMGPWTLVEVADAVGKSYDVVYRDAQRGILATQDGRLRGGRARYLVTITALRQSARPCYRHVRRATAAGPGLGSAPAGPSGATAQPLVAGAGHTGGGQAMASARTRGRSLPRR